MGLLYEELSYVVLGIIYEVHNELGTGFDEESYQLALEHKLRENNIPFRSQEIRYVVHRRERIHKFVLDLIIEDKIILELKNIETNFHPEHVFQLLSYLKCWKKQLGFLVNFGLPKVATKRMLYTAKENRVVENYEYIKALITPDIRQSLLDTRAALLAILEAHGVGYRATIYQSAFLKELAIKEIKYTPNPMIPVKCQGLFLKEIKINYPIIESQFICGIVSLKKHIKLDLIKVQTYLKALNLPFGILAHFSNEQLEIYGITPQKNIRG